MSISAQIPRNIKKASRSIAYAAWLDNPDAWLGLSTVLEARLEPQQRAALAYAALRSLSEEHAAAVCDAVLPDCTSAPIAPLFGHMDQAEHWTEWAESEALDAYCLASFNAMAGSRQAAFLDFVSRRAAA
ncbi:MAG: hypothetical protein AAF755_00095 [Pseudomonadota bacterium]